MAKSYGACYRDISPHKIISRSRTLWFALQLRKSSVSVPSNMAEGYGRNSTQDYIRFLRKANGSLFELQTQLEIAKNLGFLKEQSFSVLFELSREIERMLSSLI